MDDPLSVLPFIVVCPLVLIDSAMFPHMIEDAGHFMRRGGNCLRCSKPGAHPAIVSPERALTVADSLCSESEGGGCSVDHLGSLAALYPSTGDAVLGT